MEKEFIPGTLISTALDDVTSEHDQVGFGLADEFEVFDESLGFRDKVIFFVSWASGRIGMLSSGAPLAINIATVRFGFTISDGNDADWSYGIGFGGGAE